MRGITKGIMKPFQEVLKLKPASSDLTTLEYYQQIVLLLIKYFYMLLIGGLISFMIIHQILDYLAMRREMKEGGHHR